MKSNSINLPNKKLGMAMSMAFRVALCFMCAAGLHKSAAAQGFSRVNHYTTTPFTATWTDIMQTGTPFAYTNLRTGFGTIALPFDFRYDDSLLLTGSPMMVSVNGYISFSSAKDTLGPALDSASFPGYVCAFSSEMSAGSGKTGADSGYFQIDDTAPNRTLTVELFSLRMRHTGGGGGTGGMNPTSLQVKFHETSGIIELIYQAHNNIFATDTFKDDSTLVVGGIGLNGFSKPSFVCNVYDTNLLTTPATDIRFTPTISGVSQESAIAGFDIGNTYPNPANKSVIIPVTLSNEETLHLDIRDASGQLRKTEITGVMPTGTSNIELDTQNLDCGTYFVTVTCGSTNITRQITVVR